MSWEAKFVIFMHVWWFLPFFYFCAFGSRVKVRAEEKTAAGLGNLLSRYLYWRFGPVERALLAARVPADAITLASVGLAAVSGLLFALDYRGMAGLAYIYTGILDILDGLVARRTGTSSPAGAYADAVADRVSEGLVFMGLAWSFRDGPGLLLVMGALLASYLVSYTRARAESLGVDLSETGRMQRAERIMLLGVLMVLSPLADEHGRELAMVGVAAVGLSALVTAWHRFVSARRALSA